jgi:hypothetical protein
MNTVYWRVAPGVVGEPNRSKREEKEGYMTSFYEALGSLFTVYTTYLYIHTCETGQIVSMLRL